MRKTQPLYLSLAVLRSRHYNLMQHDNPSETQREAIFAIEQELDRLTREYLPSGSGFDRGTFFFTADPDAQLKPVLRFTTSYHHMNEHGVYDGWTQHQIKAEPDFGGLRVTVQGSNRNQIKDYIGDMFYAALIEPVPANTAIMRRDEDDEDDEPAPLFEPERQPDNSRCPECDSSMLTGGFVEIAGKEAVQTCTCGDCGASWNDVFTFSGQVLLESGGKGEE